MKRSEHQVKKEMESIGKKARDAWFERILPNLIGKQKDGYVVFDIKDIVKRPDQLRNDSEIKWEKTLEAQLFQHGYKMNRENGRLLGFWLKGDIYDR